MTKIQEELKMSVDGIMAWLDRPELHFGNENRRVLLETIIMLHLRSAIDAEQERARAEARRQRAKDFVLGVACMTALGTILTFLEAWPW